MQKIRKLLRKPGARAILRSGPGAFFDRRDAMTTYEIRVIKRGSGATVPGSREFIN
jgi:hypothetical protein